MASSGFFTASDLKHILSALGHPQIAEAISSRFLQTFRHPGESYIDYMALLDSVRLRQQRMFEDELWRHFQRVLQSSGRCDVDGICSSLFVKDLAIAARRVEFCSRAKHLGPAMSRSAAGLRRPGDRGPSDAGDPRQPRPRRASAAAGSRLQEQKCSSACSSARSLLFAPRMPASATAFRWGSGPSAPCAAPRSWTFGRSAPCSSSSSASSDKSSPMCGRRSRPSPPRHKKR